MIETAPVCLAIDKIRPAMEALAHLYLHGHRMKDDFEVCPDDEQVRYINEARPRGKRGFTLENKKKAKPRKESIEAKHLRRYEALQAKEEDGNSKATGGSGELRSRTMLYLQASRKK